MKKYICSICGYTYDPFYGDPKNNVSSMVPFEDLSDDWSCPICGSNKELFELDN